PRVRRPDSAYRCLARIQNRLAASMIANHADVLSSVAAADRSTAPSASSAACSPRNPIPESTSTTVIELNAQMKGYRRWTTAGTTMITSSTASMMLYQPTDAGSIAATVARKYRPNNHSPTTAATCET